MSKKEKIMIGVLALLILLFFLIILFVIANKKFYDNYEVKNEQVGEVNDSLQYITIEDVDMDFSLVYSNVNLKKVKFKNLSDSLYQDFNIQQDKYINDLYNSLNAKKVFIDNYNKENNVSVYSHGSEINSVILFDIKDNVLSLIYVIEDKLDYADIDSYIVNLFIDVNNNVILSNDEFLNRFSIDKSNICSSIYDSLEKTSDDSREESLKLLNDNFDEYVYLYINNGEIYYKYNKSDISKLLFDKELSNLKYSTLKITN